MAPALSRGRNLRDTYRSPKYVAQIKAAYDELRAWGIKTGRWTSTHKLRREVAVNALID